jgi:parvulin-like peptidyl-prolyl isomerase
MQPDSVAEPELRDALKTLKKGEISGPIATEKAYMLVKVIETQPARTTPFEEVQDELRKSISERKKGERITAVVEKIKSKAIVETMFDGEPVPADAQKSPEPPGKTPRS